MNIRKFSLTSRTYTLAANEELTIQVFGDDFTCVSSSQSLFRVRFANSSSGMVTDFCDWSAGLAVGIKASTGDSFDTVTFRNVSSQQTLTVKVIISNGLVRDQRFVVTDPVLSQLVVAAPDNYVVENFALTGGDAATQIITAAENLHGFIVQNNTGQSAWIGKSGVNGDSNGILVRSNSRTALFESRSDWYAYSVNNCDLTVFSFFFQ